MGVKSKQARNLATGLAFLAPNIVGVLVFTVLPVLFSIMLAFSNWDLRRHNMFKDEALDFVGFDNFVRLVTEADFLRFLGNTLFLMMGIPFAIAGALCSALLLSKDLRAGGGRPYIWLLASAGLIVSTVLLVVSGMGGTGMVILLSGLACGVLVAGVAGGTTVYRTLFYTPHFTAGVATFLLWKKLYDPYEGPINTGLAPVLNHVSDGVNALPPVLTRSASWLCLALAALLFLWALRRLRLSWVDGDLGWAAGLVPVALLCVPGAVAQIWHHTAGRALWLGAAVAIAAAWQGARVAARGKDFDSSAMNGIGSGLVVATAAMVGQFVLVGLSALLYALPELAADGLEPPRWIHEYHWAKPSIMIMGLWGAIGSNNMLLYLAALTNVPQELYEAADIDGAGRFQRFWNVTWPQLAPTTFFITVMSMIGGLQGGFEMARTMTKGGPAGATTTLSYFIYLEGFETGRLSFASAVAWALFILVFSVTLFNWKFGNRYVND
ncbi:MAG: sugar ABC transporter permease [Candidatus Hydrogenedentes bacterium]|nr:sugar ABC transporter permease [Candidatus Hydrogenedentota bacterium]